MDMKTTDAIVTDALIRATYRCNWAIVDERRRALMARAKPVAAAAAAGHADASKAFSAAVEAATNIMLWGDNWGHEIGSRF